MSRRVTQRAVSASLIVSALLLSAGLTACGKNETAASLMSEAQAYETKGDTKAALIQLKNAVAKSPEDGEVRLRLASLYLKMADPVSAEKEARKAAELKIDAARTAPVLARALVLQGQGQKALDATAAMAGGKDANVLAIRGDAYLTLNESDKAREAYLAAIAITPGQPEALIGMARLATIAKDMDGAAKLAEQAIAANPKDANAYLFKGNLLRAQNKPDEAAAAYTQAIAVKPDMSGALLERANIHIAAKKFDLAKADIEAARKVAPNALPPIYSQAVLDFSQNNYAAANDNIQKVLSKAPEHMPSLLLAGAVELNMGSFKQAEQHLNAYLSTYPNNAYARKLLAQTQLRLAEPDSAGRTLAPLLAGGGNDAQVMALAGESSLRTREFDKATQYFEKATTLQPEVASLRTSLGLSMLAQGNREKGVEELEKATSLDPKSEQAGTTLVRAEMALRHYDKALVAVKALIAAHPDNAEFRNLEGGVYLGTNNLAAARASFEKAASLKADLFGPVMNLAQLDVKDGKPEAAKKRLTAFAEKNKGASPMVALADLALSQKNVSEATSWLEKAVADNPADLPAAGRLVLHYLRTNQAPKALTLARKLQSANPTKPELLDALGQAQLANKDDAGALDSYSKLAGMLPKSAAVQLRLAAVHLRLKNEAAATADLKRALELDPGNQGALAGQVEMAMRARKPDAALAVARSVQKSTPKSPLGFTLEGDIMAAQKKFDGAQRAYDQAFALAPSATTLVKSASALNATGKPKEATAKMLAWINSHPGDNTATLYLGELLLSQKDFAGAATIFEGLLKAAPNDPLLLNNLAWAYQQTKDPRALATAEHAAKVAPESGPVLDTLGWMLVEKGDVAKALPILQKAVTLNPNARELRYHLAVALAKSGNKQSARAEIDKVLSGEPFANTDDAKALLKNL
ncbi:MAG: prsT [Massilia sp.]|jgi:putative PEP-CTERM system TPR-repeat lipoprotein|nr:prsT [Massilia sp.]